MNGIQGGRTDDLTYHARYSGAPDRSEFIYSAAVAGATTVRQWTKYPAQKSKTYTLQAGQRVYLEAIQKEAAGADHMAIGWTLPGATAVTVIPGSALESYAYDANDADGDNMPDDWEALHALDPLKNDAAGDPDKDGIPNHLGEQIRQGTAHPHQHHRPWHGLGHFADNGVQLWTQALARLVKIYASS